MQTIHNTLLYSDMFDFPLTAIELWYYYKGTSVINKTNFIKLISKNTKVEYAYGYYFLAGRKNIVTTRKRRQRISKLKIAQCKRTIQLLSLIPTIQCIAISGSIASKNAKDNDDIDLFIITKKKTIWITRLSMLLLLHSTGKARRKKFIKTNNLLCLNMFVDEGAMSFPKERQDIFTAHEIAQLTPLFERNNTYKRFLYANKWIKDFMPHVLIYHKVTKKASSINEQRPHIIWTILEQIAKRIQLYMIKKTRTSETISDTFLAFHPHDYRKHIVATYIKKVTTYA